MFKYASWLVIFVLVLMLYIYCLVGVNKKGDINNDLICNQLYELKKEKYFKDEIGQSKAMYSKKLDTCIAYNLCSDFCHGEEDKFI